MAKPPKSTCSSQDAAGPSAVGPKRDRFPLGKLAIASGDSGNRKIGDAATTYAAQTSCPTSCPFFAGGGCYAESGTIGKFITEPLNRAAAGVEHTALDVADAEADAIDELEVVAGRALRLHSVGDCASDEAARAVSGAAARYRARGGGPVWTYTHAWREVARGSWGEVSVLASCETDEDVELAHERGYGTAVVVEAFEQEGRHLVAASDSPLAGVNVLPCREQTRNVSCTDCRLCFNDAKLRERGISIAFELHGTPFTVRQAKKALRTPDDPDRRLTTRQLIPRVIAEIEAEGGRVTNSEIARRLDCNPGSVAEMRGKLAQDERERST